MDGYCKYFRWIDPPICERSKQIIPGLLRKLNEHKLKCRTLESQVHKLEEMTRILQSANCVLEKENEMLQLERKKAENKYHVFKFLVMTLKMIVVVWACFVLITMLG